MKSNKETYMNSNYLYPGSDLEGDARESEKLQIAERMPQPRRLAMPQMSDGEIYLRLNVPDGLQTNGQQTQQYGIVQKAHADPSRSAIKSESGA
jgi:hypothetical protein